MDKESVERLRFDRRLQQRPDWAEKADQDAFLESLPDVSEKMTTCGKEEETAEEVVASTVVAEAPPAISAPVPTAGDFSAPSPFGGFRNESGGN